MAMINCPECGQEISDLSDVCIKCGCPINASNNEKSKKGLKLVWKILIPMASIVIISFVVVLIINIITKSRYEDGLFSGIKWGTSYDEVLAKTPILVDGEKISEDEILGGIKTDEEEHTYIMYYVINYDEYEGFKLLIAFRFENEKLYEVDTTFASAKDSEYSLVELYDFYDNEFEDLFGDCVSDSKLNKTWINDNSVITLTSTIESSISAYELRELSGFKFMDRTYSE